MQNKSLLQNTTPLLFHLNKRNLLKCFGVSIAGDNNAYVNKTFGFKKKKSMLVVIELRHKTTFSLETFLLVF